MKWVFTFMVIIPGILLLIIGWNEINSLRVVSILFILTTSVAMILANISQDKFANRDLDEVKE